MMSKKNSVLLVTDTDSNLTPHRNQLESSGFSVVTVLTSEDGIALFKSGSVDAVVVDEAAEKESQHAFTAAIKQLNPRTPVIMVAESVAVAEKIRALVDALVLKSQEPEQLSDKLKSLIKIRSHSHPQLDNEYVVFSDGARRYLDCSDGVCNLLGYSRMELLGMTIDDVSYRPQKTHGLFEEYVKHGSLEGQYILRHKSGKPVFIQYRSEIFPDGCMAAVWEPVEDWKQIYQSAMLEFNPGKLKDRVELARHAIEERMRSLPQASAADAAERQQLQDALSGLRVLAREVHE
jgi:CheY-like chemotaxis protein